MHAAASERRPTHVTGLMHRPQAPTPTPTRAHAPTPTNTHSRHRPQRLLPKQRHHPIHQLLLGAPAVAHLRGGAGRGALGGEGGGVLRATYACTHATPAQRACTHSHAHTRTHTHTDTCTPTPTLTPPHTYTHALTLAYPPVSQKPRTRRSRKMRRPGGMVSGCWDMAPYETSVPEGASRRATAVAASPGVGWCVCAGGGMGGAWLLSANSVPEGGSGHAALTLDTPPRGQSQHTRCRTHPTRSPGPGGGWAAPSRPARRRPPPGSPPGCPPAP